MSGGELVLGRAGGELDAKAVAAIVREWQGEGPPLDPRSLRRLVWLELPLEFYGYGFGPKPAESRAVAMLARTLSGIIQLDSRPCFDRRTMRYLLGAPWADPLEEGAAAPEVVVEWRGFGHGWIGWRWLVLPAGHRDFLREQSPPETVRSDDPRCCAKLGTLVTWAMGRAETSAATKEAPA